MVYDSSFHFIKVMKIFDFVKKNTKISFFKIVIHFKID